MSNSQQKNAISMIEKARVLQQQRYSSCTIYNGSLSSKDVDKYTTLDTVTSNFLVTAAKKLDLSPRSYFKVIKVARTIADLEGAEAISIAHLAESLQYRQVVAV